MMNGHINPSPRGRIAFVNPPYERIAPGYGFVKHVTNRSPSLGLLHLAAEVRGHGWEPSIIESDIEDLDAAGVVERVVALNPAYVGITLFTVGVAGSVEIARELKKRLPKVQILVGGPHVSSMGPETVQRFECFDVAVQGEGEKILVALLDALDAGRDLAEVHGIIYRDDGVVRVNPPDKTPNVLDDLPFPAWDLLPGFPHKYPLAVYDYPAGPVATIAASRGCPFHCKFCDTSTFGARVRYYSPAKVVEMMEHLRDRYGVRHVLFVDDLFLASRKRTTEFCNLVIERNVGMTWSCAARVDTVWPPLLELMKRAGCWQISFGLETGDAEMLKKMDKVAKLERSEEAVKETAAAGIRVKGLFMLGYPGETAGKYKADQGVRRPDPDDNNEPDEVHALPRQPGVPRAVRHQHPRGPLGEDERHELRLDARRHRRGVARPALSGDFEGVLPPQARAARVRATEPAPPRPPEPAGAVRHRLRGGQGQEPARRPPRVAAPGRLGRPRRARARRAAEDRRRRRPGSVRDDAGDAREARGSRRRSEERKGATRQSAAKGGLNERW